MTQVVCVIDAGTTGVRCALVAPDGRVLRQAERPLEVRHPEPGAAEQDPHAMWEAVVAAVADATGTSDAGDHEIVAVTVSAQRATVMMTDASGRPLSPLLLWMDQRGATALPELADGVSPERFSSITGLPFGAMPALTRLLWLRATDPELFGRAARIVGVSDWITSRLVGAPTAVDRSCAGWTGLLDVESGAWSAEILEAAGLDAGLLPDVVSATDVVGTVSAGAGVGIPTGVPVFAGGGDQQCSSAGAGAGAPGRASLNLGTSATFVAAATSADPVGRGMIRNPHLFDGLEDREGTIPACGSLIRWLAGTLGYGASGEGYAALMQDAAEVETGELRFVPVFAGHGTPDWQPASASLSGLDFSHDRRHLARAALEGVGVQFGRILHELDRVGARPDEVALIGGAARSPEFAQILADVSGQELIVPDGDPQLAALRGAASAAWLGLDRPGAGVASRDATAQAAAPGAPAGRRFVPATAGRYGHLYADYDQTSN